MTVGQQRQLCQALFTFAFLPFCQGFWYFYGKNSIICSAIFFAVKNTGMLTEIEILYMSIVSVRICWDPHENDQNHSCHRSVSNGNHEPSEKKPNLMTTQLLVYKYTEFLLLLLSDLTCTCAMDVRT